MPSPDAVAMDCNCASESALSNSIISSQANEVADNVAIISDLKVIAEAAVIGPVNVPVVDTNTFDNAPFAE